MHTNMYHMYMVLELNFLVSRVVTRTYNFVYKNRYVSVLTLVQILNATI